MARGVNQEAVKIEDRRRKVLQLYLRHQTQTEIARVLSVDQKTISNDIAAIRKNWTEQNLLDFDAIKQREAAELDEMEAEAAVEFGKRKNWEWFDRRLKCKERRAKLLGLDEPTKTDSNVNLRNLSDEDLIARATGSLGGDSPPGLDPELIERAIAKRDELGE